MPGVEKNANVVANILVLATANTVISLFYEERKSREIRRIFSSYVSPKIVEQLVNHPEKAKLGGERKEVTLLFSDIRGFTSFSEKRDPEEVVAMLNEYFEVMAGAESGKIGHLEMLEADTVTVRGKEVPVNVYALSSDPH